MPAQGSEYAIVISISVNVHTLVIRNMKALRGYGKPIGIFIVQAEDTISEQRPTAA